MTLKLSDSYGCTPTSELPNKHELNRSPPFTQLCLPEDKPIAPSIQKIRRHKAMVRRRTIHNVAGQSADICRDFIPRSYSDPHGVGQFLKSKRGEQAARQAQVVDGDYLSANTRHYLADLLNSPNSSSKAVGDQYKRQDKVHISNCLSFSRQQPAHHRPQHHLIVDGEAGDIQSSTDAPDTVYCYIDSAKPVVTVRHHHNQPVELVHTHHQPTRTPSAYGRQYPHFEFLAAVDKSYGTQTCDSNTREHFLTDHHQQYVVTDMDGLGYVREGAKQIKDHSPCIEWQEPDIIYCHQHGHYNYQQYNNYNNHHSYPSEGKEILNHEYYDEPPSTSNRIPIIDTVNAPPENQKSQKLPLALKRSATMPAQRIRPNSHGHDQFSAAYGFSNTDAQLPVRNSQEQYKLQTGGERPGRGLFSQTGRKVHLSQPRPATTGFTRPTALNGNSNKSSVIRHSLDKSGPQLIQNSNAHQTHTINRLTSPQNSPPQLPARNDAFNAYNHQHKVSTAQQQAYPDLMHSAGRQPIDNLRTKIHQPSTQMHPYHNNVFNSKAVESHVNPAVYDNLVTHARVGANGGTSGKPQAQLNHHNMNSTVFYKDNSHREMQQHGYQSWRSRTPSPAKIPDNQVQPRRTNGPQQKFHESHSPPRRVTKSQSPRRADGELAQRPSSYHVEDYPVDEPPRRHTISQPPNVTVPPQRPQHRSVSNKYRMLVCPDFFPLAKLNQTRRGNKKLEYDNEAQLELADSHPKAAFQDNTPGFYGNQTNIPPELLTNLDDSYVEDCPEQYLYSSNNTHSRSYHSPNITQGRCHYSPNTVRAQTDKNNIRQNLADYYFQVNLPSSTDQDQAKCENAQVASGPSSPLQTHSLPHTSIQKENPKPTQNSQTQVTISQYVNISPQSSVHTSRTSPNLSTSTPRSRFQPPKPARSHSPSTHYSRRSPTTSQSVSPHVRLPEDIPAVLHKDGQHNPQETGGEEYLQYERVNAEGQKGRTAVVLALIEPENSTQSNYSTVRVYRRPEPTTMAAQTQVQADTAAVWNLGNSQYGREDKPHVAGDSNKRRGNHSLNSEPYYNYPKQQHPPQSTSAYSIHPTTGGRTVNSNNNQLPYHNSTESYQHTSHSNNKDPVHRRQQPLSRVESDYGILSSFSSVRPDKESLSSINPEDFLQLRDSSESTSTALAHSSPKPIPGSVLAPPATHLLPHATRPPNSSVRMSEVCVGTALPIEPQHSPVRITSSHRNQVEQAYNSDGGDDSEMDDEARFEAEISELIDDLDIDNIQSILASGSDNLSEGLGEDILSITRMWKNLPASDSWKEKRRALLDDPIMSAISEKMQAILKAAGSRKSDSNNNSGGSETSGGGGGSRRQFTVTQKPVVEDNNQLLESVASPPYSTREPGEGSSDDLNDSTDLHKKIRSNHPTRQIIKPHPSRKPASHDASFIRHKQPDTNSFKLHSSLEIDHQAMEQVEKIKPLDNMKVNQNQRANSSALNETNKSFQRHTKPLDPTVENLFDMPYTQKGLSTEKSQSLSSDTTARGDNSSDSEEMIEENSAVAFATDSVIPLPDGSGESDEVEEEGRTHYLSDFHKLQNKTKKKASRKKISFSKTTEPLTSANENLLSTNPFLKLRESPEMTAADELELSSPVEGSGSDQEPCGKLAKPRHGILKRSEDSGGSQLSLGTCSAFGSHVSLDSMGSGLSRAGSFPLLTMSDGSKKDFKISFNDSDVSDMGNLFKVTRKARSEGAASEPESTDSDSDDDAMPIICKYCHAKQPLFKARLLFKMCHGCYTYYCSSECRRLDWTAHKPLCIVSRLSSLARKIFKCITTDLELLQHCSRFARTGYLCEGRGAVVLSFASPRKAQLFLSNANQAKESALYLSIKDLQKYTFDDKRDRDELISNCRHYDPNDKFVLHLAIKMNKSLSSQTIEPRIRGREFHKWARIRLADRHHNPKKEVVDEEDTLILTAMSTNGEAENEIADIPEHKLRKVFFANVQTKLRNRGISLRHQYPDVYNALCHYVTAGKVFAPISLFAFNLRTQKRFMCCIMPYSYPEMNWGNNPHLINDLDLSVTL